MSEESQPRVLVTGAGGFVGGRLSQRLALGTSFEVLPLVHRFSGPGAMRLARLPVDIEQGSVTDRATMAEIVTDCDAVVHCAVGTEETIVDGSRVLFEVARNAGVDSFVHMSSAAVHGLDTEGTIRETTPFAPDTAYARSKIEAEEELERLAAAADLSPTVFRPFIVYGPHSEFVHDPMDMIKAGAILADGGEGHLNQVYVDNLVDAILLALEDPAAKGETFMVADKEDVTWQRYYRELASMMGDHPPIQSQSSRQIRRHHAVAYATNSVMPPINMISRIASTEETQQTVMEELQRMPWAMGLFSRLPEPVSSRVQAVFNGDRPDVVTEDHTESQDHPDVDYTVPTERYRKLQTSTGQVSTRKLEDVLGWEQRTSFSEALDLIASWAAYEGLVEPSTATER